MITKTILLSKEEYDRLKDSDRRLNHLRSGGSIWIQLPNNYGHDLLTDEDTNRIISDLRLKYQAELSTLREKNRALRDELHELYKRVEELSYDSEPKKPFFKRLFTKKPR